MRAQNSLKYKLLKLLICVTVIPTLIIGCALNAAMASTGQMNRHKADTFDQFAEELETILKDLTDSEATKAFLQLRGEPDTESYYLSAVRLSEKMDTLITQRGDAVDAVAFLWNDGSLPVARSNGYRMPLEGDYRGNVFYQAMKQSDAAVHWIVLPETTDGLPGLFLYKTIYNAFADENLGVAVIHVNRAYICSIIQTAEQAADSTMLMAADGKRKIFPAVTEKEGRYFYASGQQENNSRHDNHGRIPEKETSDKEAAGHSEGRPPARSGCPQAGRVIIRLSPPRGHCRRVHQRVRQSRCPLKGGRRVYTHTGGQGRGWSLPRML